MQIDIMQTARLVPYIRNARTHSADQVAQIAASIAEFGFTNPILIGEDDVIIAGHGRLMAAQSLGLAQVPVIVLDHLSGAQRRALILADNRIAENAGWDNAMLASELAALRDDNFDLDMIGFDEAELEELLAGFEFDDAGALGGEGQGGGVGDSDHPPATSSSGSLAARFGIPPFSILDARQRLAQGLQTRRGQGVQRWGGPRRRWPCRSSGQSRHRPPPEKGSCPWLSRPPAPSART